MTFRHRKTHLQLLDYVLTMGRNQPRLLMTTTLCVAKCWTDHRAENPAAETALMVDINRKTNIAVLDLTECEQDFVSNMSTSIMHVQYLQEECLEKIWSGLPYNIHQTTKEALDPKSDNAIPGGGGDDGNVIQHLASVKVISRDLCEQQHYRTESCFLPKSKVTVTATAGHIKKLVGWQV
ncbi:hypothetical protein AAHC03_0887 [Spirometra sp. Aus1]